MKYLVRRLERGSVSLEYLLVLSFVACGGALILLGLGPLFVETFLLHVAWLGLPVP